MKDKQENKLSMYNAVQQVMNSFRNLWSGMAGFAETVAALSNKITAIELTAAMQDRVITGITADKQARKTVLASYTAMIAGAVHAYADSISNEELRKSVDFSRSEFLRMRDEMLDERCRNIHDVAQEQLGNLSGYGITQMSLDALLELISKYQVKVPQPRVARSTKNTHTKHLTALYSETDRLLKRQLDKMMLMFKDGTSYSGAPPVPIPPVAAANAVAVPPPVILPVTDFYALYVQAREIIDLGKHTFHFVDIEIPKGGSISIPKVVDQEFAFNTGKTIISWRDSLRDEPLEIGIGDKMKINSPSGIVVVTNRGTTRVGRIHIKVYKK